MKTQTHSVSEKRRKSWRTKNYRRRAAAAGLTVEAYVARLGDKKQARAAREEAAYCRFERRAKRDECREETRRLYNAAYMLARYHADPANWSTARKRRHLFERDAWQCRVCGKAVTDTVEATHPSRAVAGHILAAATGGQWTDENMATLCYPCNIQDGVNRVPIQTSLTFFARRAGA